MLSTLVASVVLFFPIQEPEILGRKGLYAEVTPKVKSLMLEYENAQRSGKFEIEQRIARENETLIGKTGHYEFDAHLCRQLFVIHHYEGRRPTALTWGRKGVEFASKADHEILHLWLKRVSLIAAFQVDLPTDSEWDSFLPILQSLKKEVTADNKGKLLEINELYWGLSFFSTERAGNERIPMHHIKKTVEMWWELCRIAKKKELGHETLLHHFYAGTTFAMLNGKDSLALEAGQLAFSIPIVEDNVFEATASVMAIAGVFPDMADGILFEIDPILNKTDPERTSDGSIMFELAHMLISYARGEKEVARAHLHSAQKKLNPKTAPMVRGAVFGSNAVLMGFKVPSMRTTTSLADEAHDLTNLLNQGKYEEVKHRGTKAIQSETSTGFFQIAIKDCVIEARFALGEKGEDFVAAIRECRADYLNRWSARFAPSRPIGTSQNLVSNPMSRFGLMLASLGQTQEGLETVEAGRSWGILAAILRNQSKAKLVDQLVTLPSMSPNVNLAGANNADTVLVSYVVTKDRRPAAFVIFRGKIHFVELNTTYFELEKLANLWRKELEATATKGPLQSETRLSRQMAKIIFDPILGITGVVNAKRFYVVPDGPIGGIPLIALTNSAGSRLIDNLSIVIRPTHRPFANVSTTTSKSKRHGFIVPSFTSPASSENRPVFENLDVLQLRSKQLARQANAKLIDTALPSANALESALAGLDVIQIVTHGVSKTDRLMESFLLIGQSKDGPITATVGEICNFQINAEFVGLWACHTAEGQVQGGDGNIGLAWAFFNAGAQSLVASKWAVDQTAVASLLEDFNNRIRLDGASYEKALLLAIRKLKARKPAPGHWAPFEYYAIAYSRG